MHAVHTRPRKYWSHLKRKLQAEGSEVYKISYSLKLKQPVSVFPTLFAKGSPKEIKSWTIRPFKRAIYKRRTLKFAYYI
jgi:hypothetical protein